MAQTPSSRPLSPHLQVYKQPLTALLSISHRATGIVNSVALVLIVWTLAAAASPGDSYGFIGAVVQSWFGKLMMFGFTLTLYYHLCNGIRHLFWDVGIGFDLEAANRSARVTLFATFILSVITWMAALA